MILENFGLWLDEMGTTVMIGPDVFRATSNDFLTCSDKMRHDIPLYANQLHFYRVDFLST